ncbi:hypothetical protein EAO71_12760, partial [Streptomyces sp. ms191]
MRVQTRRTKIRFRRLRFRGPAPPDAPYREVVFEDRLLTVAGGLPVWLLTVSGVLVAAVGSV